MEYFLAFHLIFCIILFIIISTLLSVEAFMALNQTDKEIRNWFTKGISRGQLALLGILFYPTAILCLITYPVVILIFGLWNYMGKIGKRD